MIAYSEAVTAVVVGLQGRLVRVEVALAQGLPAWNLVGLPDAQVAEARDRVRAAVASTGRRWPDVRITVGLSPASMPKSGSGLDLAIAAAVLAASGQLPVAAGDLRDALILGELGLDGRVRPVRGALTMLVAAGRAGVRRAYVPFGNAGEAGLMPDMEVEPVRSLAHLAALLADDAEAIAATEVVPAYSDLVGDDAVAAPLVAPLESVDLNHVRGQPLGRRAVEVAAAGAHHLAIIGRPGVGKTMLATALAGVLPDLDTAASLEVTSVHATSGRLNASQGLVRRPPWYAPHHSASAISLIGGGTQDRPVPGQVTLAHRGVLLLDEAAEFDPHVLDSLRQPLEAGTISIARAGMALTLPAEFQLVMTTNPCPCGLWLDADPGEVCTCPPARRRRYLARISGPLLDRVEIQVVLSRPHRQDLSHELAGLPETGPPDTGPPDTGPRVAGPRVTEMDGTRPISEVPGRSVEIRQRVERARAAAADRWQRLLDSESASMISNARVPADLLALAGWRREAESRLDALARSGESTRGVQRVRRVAWTLADLAGRDLPTVEDVEEAIVLRHGLLRATGTGSESAFRDGVWAWRQTGSQVVMPTDDGDCTCSAAEPVSSSSYLGAPRRPPATSPPPRQEVAR